MQLAIVERLGPSAKNEGDSIMAKDSMSSKVAKVLVLTPAKKKAKKKVGFKPPKKSKVSK